MEAWPTVAWVLLLTTIADWLNTAQSRDFTMKDIILLHPSSRSIIILQMREYSHIMSIPQCNKVCVRAPQLHLTLVPSSASHVKMLQITTSVTAGHQMCTVQEVHVQYHLYKTGMAQFFSLAADLNVLCFPGTRYCYTRHMMDNQGDSVSVTKRCVSMEHCLLTGCDDVPSNGNRVCVCGPSGLN